MRESVAYIRRSVASRADPGDTSRDFQVIEVGKLAGGPLKVIDGDWGKSASGDKTDRRLAFLALLESIEAGDVAELYAYSTDRLARSVEWSARLLNACRRARVPIITREGRIEPGDAAAALLFNVLAAVNENALSGMEAKARDTIETRKRRNREAGKADNEGMGRKPYGSLPGESTEAVIRAFEDAGRSFNGAAKLLKDRGVRSRLDGQPNPRGNGGSYGWNARTIGRIVRRERPDLAPTWLVRQGTRSRSTRLFSGLLSCTCRAILTTMGRGASPSSRQRTSTVAYYCRHAHSDASHSRPYVVAESKILPWAKEEAARLRVPFDTVEMGEESAKERAALESRRAVIEDMYELNGPTWRSEYLRRTAAVTEALASLDAQTQIVRIPPIDWTQEPGAVNVGLRLLWHSIQLDEGLNPVAAAWRVPEWRSA